MSRKSALDRRVVSDPNAKLDGLLARAARSLALGDPLGALASITLRTDAAALALRGIACAQLGDFSRARQLLTKAAQRFKPNAHLAHARTTVALAEVTLAARDLPAEDTQLAHAITVLEQHGDVPNALYARLIQARQHVLLGAVDVAHSELHALGHVDIPPRLAASFELVAAEIAVRAVRAKEARSALLRAQAAAQRARIPALSAEVEHALQSLARPVARVNSSGEPQLLDLAAVEALLQSPVFLIDACRRIAQLETFRVQLARRPTLFVLLRALGEAWPHALARDALLQVVFAGERPNDSHRARLRVELVRLRRALQPCAQILHTAGGYVLTPNGGAAVTVLAPPVEGRAAAVLGLLGDGSSWPAAGLALALGVSQRSAQRALAELEESGRVRSLGLGRNRRWIVEPLAGFATTMLLPVLPA